jgi:hypothetical protein
MYSVHRVSDCLSPWQPLRRIAAFVVPVAVAMCLAFSSVAPCAIADEVPAWLPKGVKSLPGWMSEEIAAWVKGNEVFLTLPRVSRDAVLRVPRLVGVVKDVRWLSGTEEKLNIQPEPMNWSIRLSSIPKELKKGELATIVIELDQAPAVFSDKSVKAANEDGLIVLTAREAIVHGENIRYEPQPHKNTVGYWSNEKDSIEWKFAVPKAGEYEIDILQGCGKGHGDSLVVIETQMQKLELTVQDTGHFQNFIWRGIGTVTLKKSEGESLTIKCTKKAGGAVMDVRSLRLVPKGATRSFEGEFADPAAIPRVM